MLTILTRAKIVSWMNRTANVEGERHIASKAVRNFPQFFRSTSNANIIRASRLWKARKDYQGNDGSCGAINATVSVTRNIKNGLKRVSLKDRSGRGRKHDEWVGALHQDLRSEFDRLRRLGFKFNLNTLRYLAFDLLSNSQNTA